MGCCHGRSQAAAAASYSEKPATMDKQAAQQGVAANAAGAAVETIVFNNMDGAAIDAAASAAAAADGHDVQKEVNGNGAAMADLSDHGDGLLAKRIVHQPPPPTRAERASMRKEQKRQESIKKREDSKKRKEEARQSKRKAAEEAQLRRKQAKAAQAAKSLTEADGSADPKQSAELRKRGSRHLRLGGGSQLSLDARIAAMRASQALAEGGEGHHQDEEDDETKWIYLTEEDEAEVERVAKTESGAKFHLHELQTIYAAFKENEMKLPRESFNIVYCTYARISNPVMMDHVFDLFDKDHSGFFDYREFIDFLGAMVRGDADSRAAFFFKIYDRDNDGVLSKEDLVYFVSKLSIEKILAYHGRQNHSEPLPSLAEGDEENEAAMLEQEAEREAVRRAEEEAAAAAKKREEDEKIKAQLVSTYRASKRGKDGEKQLAGRKTDPAVESDPSLSKARAIVDKCFDEMEYVGDTISLQDFVNRMYSSGTLKMFLPF